MYGTLGYIAEKLNEGKVVWGIGASILLNYYELVDKPNDIDILVDLHYIEKADMILSCIGDKKNWEKTNEYSTRYFYEYVVNGIDVDVISGMRIRHVSGIFEYKFDQSSISEVKMLNGQVIPLTSLEDWYVLYQVIPNREKKAAMLEEYLLANGVKNPALLERALEGDLPEQVSNRVIKILNHSNPERGNRK